MRSSEAYFAIARSHWSSVIFSASFSPIGDSTDVTTIPFGASVGSPNFRVSSSKLLVASLLRNSDGMAESRLNRTRPKRLYPARVRSQAET